MFELNDIIIVAGAVFGILLFSSAKALRPASNSSYTKISVIIPVRNEEHNIAHLLSDLAAQTYDIYEIICVDDGSEDDTAAKIREFGVKLISAGGLPRGWKGKPWACQRGAEQARGDVLLFLDADVRLGKRAVEVLASNIADGGSCVSVQPYHKTKKPFEQLSLFFNTVQAMASGAGLAFRARKCGLFGPVFLIGKKLFFENGGYGAVKNETVEDYTLGRFLSRKNVALNLFLGGRHISYRMYPLGFGSLLEGWAKNFSTGAIKTKWWMLIMAVVYITALTAVPLEIAQSIANADAVRLWVMLGAYVFFAAHLYFVSSRLGTFKAAVCALYPFVLLAFHLIFIYSAVSTYVFRSTTWKGRRL
jgi:4,4'-diaponeurosporenoate glycosyltransferase